ncbi:MAG TPA: glycosyltransferase family 1 protein [Urbifossiella sp.]|nr:glycosyltransferase family 1 protein [Urbifossiella sp.]
MARILIATDAWHPQVNGVVRTLETTASHLRDFGHVVEIVEPGPFASVAVPFYPEIAVACPRPGRIYDRVRRFRPDHVHIATEGPIGLMVRRYCQMRHWRFSTSYHTRFPEYLRRLAGVPERGTYRFLKWFHGGSSSLMVATPSLAKELQSRGFQAPLRRWSRGVDLGVFYRRSKPEVPYARPVLLYVGRISHEKNIEAFLKLKTAGTKLLVGDGPARSEFERRYPDAIFLGYRRGADLGELYATADLFVFPSITDTFGIVVIEALASGLPVAAFPVTGPIDTLTRAELGALDADLGEAVRRALAHGNPIACAAEGRSYTWENCTRQFEANLVPIV